MATGAEIVPRLARLALLILVLPVQAAALEPARGQVVLTVAGAVGETNRPPVGSGADAVLAFHGIAGRAAEFDGAMLAGLEWRAVVAHAEGREAAVRAAGPRLPDVLAAAGVPGDATVSLVALDGDRVELTPEDRAARDWVLALRADGAPLGIGGRGPAWLLEDTDGARAPAEDAARWIHSVFAIVAHAP